MSKEKGFSKLLLEPIEYLTAQMEFREAISLREFTTAKELFNEYASEIEINLDFQNFNEELENIQEQYSRPKGVIFIIYTDSGIPMGCFGIRALEDSICELKRMYVRKGGRGQGVGTQMLKKSVEIGKELGYKKVRLDTLITMHTAIGLYTKIGFYEIEPYRFNPIHGAKYFEITIRE